MLWKSGGGYDANLTEVQGSICSGKGSLWSYEPSQKHAFLVTTWRSMITAVWSTLNFHFFFLHFQLMPEHLAPDLNISAHLPTPVSWEIPEASCETNSSFLPGQKSPKYNHVYEFIAGLKTIMLWTNQITVVRIPAWNIQLRGRYAMPWQHTRGIIFQWRNDMPWRGMASPPTNSFFKWNSLADTPTTDDDYGSDVLL